MATICGGAVSLGHLQGPRTAGRLPAGRWLPAPFAVAPGGSALPVSSAQAPGTLLSGLVKQRSVSHATCVSGMRGERKCSGCQK